MSAVLDYLPRGNTLSDEEWHRRHKLLQWLLGLHLPGLFVFGVLRGYAPADVAETLALPLACLIIGHLLRSRRLAAAAITLGLVYCSAALVGFSGGAIEAHFHFFIIIGFIALYQDWVPFLLDILFTVLSHGIGSSFVPDLMFNHTSAQQHPWQWSVIHGAAVLAACVGVVLFWKTTEDEQGRSLTLTKQLADAEIGRRRFTSDLLVNLARRNQNLLYRQLDLLNDLEDKERDPDALADLFRLDHLATRIRRNAESLLVLSGEESPRIWREPVQLVDVVRAAIAEIEDLDRVDDAIDESLAVSGRSVADLTHLFAELLENAVHFSPPGVMVVVRSRPVPASPGTHLVTVEDWGVGMTAQELAEANEILRAPREVDLSVSQRLGLHVVARLARRYGITVELTPTPGGGVTAVAMLPPVVFERAPELVGAGAAPTGGYAPYPGSRETTPGSRETAPGFRTPPAGIPAQRGNGSLTGTPANGTAINGSTAAPLNGDARPAGLSSGPSALDAGPRPPAGSGAIDAGPRPAAGFDPIDAGARPPAASGAIDAGPRPAAGPGAMDAGARPAGLDSGPGGLGAGPHPPAGLNSSPGGVVATPPVRPSPARPAPPLPADPGLALPRRGPGEALARSRPTPPPTAPSLPTGDRLPPSPTDTPAPAFPADTGAPGLPRVPGDNNAPVLPGLPADTGAPAVPGDTRGPGLPADTRGPGLPADTRGPGLPADGPGTTAPGASRIDGGAVAPADRGPASAAGSGSAPPPLERRIPGDGAAAGAARDGNPGWPAAAQAAAGGDGAAQPGYRNAFRARDDEDDGWSSWWTRATPEQSSRPEPNGTTPQAQPDGTPHAQPNGNTPPRPDPDPVPPPEPRSPADDGPQLRRRVPQANLAAGLRRERRAAGDQGREPGGPGPDGGPQRAVPLPGGPARGPRRRRR